MPKLYSRAEANALLPELTPLLESIREQATRLAAIEKDLQELRRQQQANGYGGRAEKLTGQAAVAEHDLRRGLARLEELDIELKDPWIGLIDFFHEYEGRIVYLCWKLGEPEVLYWHDLETGFAGRQLLP